MVWTGNLETWKLSWTFMVLGSFSRTTTTYARIKPHKWIPILSQNNPTFAVVPDCESLDRRANIITPCSVTPSHTGNLVSWTLHKHDTECLRGQNLFAFLLSVTSSEMGSEPITHSLSVRPLTNTRHGTNWWHCVWHSVRHNHRMTKRNCVVWSRQRWGTDK